MTTQRFDVCYSKDGCTIEPHFCRQWDEDGGCYGTNPTHGYSFDEACDQVAEYHEQQAKAWRERTAYECTYYREQA